MAAALAFCSSMPPGRGCHEAYPPIVRIGQDPYEAFLFQGRDELTHGLLRHRRTSGQVGQPDAIGGDQVHDPQKGRPQAGRVVGHQFLHDALGCPQRPVKERENVLRIVDQCHKVALLSVLVR
jgi:hypothetical protein